MGTLPSQGMWAGESPGTSMDFSFQKFMLCGAKPTPLLWREEITRSSQLGIIHSILPMILREDTNSNLLKNGENPGFSQESNRPGLVELCPAQLADFVSGKKILGNLQIFSLLLVLINDL